MKEKQKKISVKKNIPNIQSKEKIFRGEKSESEWHQVKKQKKKPKSITPRRLT